MLAERFFTWLDDYFYKRKYGVDYERFKTREKEVIIFRYPKGVPDEEAIRTVHNISQVVNDNKETFQSPVLILQEGLELESVPIEELENILEHAKKISGGAHLEQQERFKQNLEGTAGLEDLIPKEVRENG